MICESHLYHFKNKNFEKPLLLFHFINSCSMDANLVGNPTVRQCCTTINQYILDSFSTKQWIVCEGNSAAYHFKQLMFKQSEYIHKNPHLKAWKQDQELGWVPADHHHNLLARVKLLPLTFRGGQLKKCTALMWLKQIVSSSKFLPKLSAFFALFAFQPLVALWTKQLWSLTSVWLQNF